MPYDTDDPRAQLSNAGPTLKGVPRPATYRRLREVAADEELTDESRTWWTRSQAMVTAWSDVRPGDALMVEANGEHALLVLEGASKAFQSAESSASSSLMRMIVRARW